MSSAAGVARGQVQTSRSSPRGLGTPIFLLKAPLSTALAISLLALGLGFPAWADSADPEERIGLLGPSLEGPWSFGFILYGWIPDRVQFKTKDTDTGETGRVRLDTADLLDAIRGPLLEFHASARKGSFGAYLDFIFISLQFDEDKGDFRLAVDDNPFLLNYGVSYEAARWTFGSEDFSSELSLEGFFGGRSLIDPVEVKVRHGDNTFVDKNIDLEGSAPVLGARAYLDLTERWNLIFSGDYGGFGVDKVRETWQATGLVGYRFELFGVASNMLVGYRGLGFDTKQSGIKVNLLVRGPIIGLGVEF